MSALLSSTTFHDLNTPFTRYNRLSNPLYNRFDNHVEQTATVRSTVMNEQPLFVQPVVKPSLTAVFKEQLFVQPVVKRCQTGLYNRFDNHVERTATVRATGCQSWFCNRLDNRLYTQYSRLSNGFDNRLNVCIHDTTGCQTGLTTGCIVYTNIYPVVKPV